MARISFFEISGLAGRRKIAKHALREDVNVIWGYNGSGKTSLLKILHSALLNDATPLIRVPFTRATVGIVDEHGDKEYVRTVTKDDLRRTDVGQLALADSDDDDEELRQQYIRNLQAHAVSLSAEWKTEPKITTHRFAFRHGYLPISRVSEARARRRRTRPMAELIDEASFDKLFAEQITDLWFDYNQRALVQIRMAQDRGLARIIGLVLATKESGSPVSIEDADVAYRIVKEFFANQGRLGTMLNLSREAFIRNYESNRLAQEVVSEVVDVQRGINLAQEPQHEIESLLGRLYGGKKKVELRGREVVISSGQTPIPLESLSSGEKQLLQLLLECLAAGPNPVLIDEPELSLHVDWQNQLVQNMRIVNESAQLIMATHSPEVMASLADHHIIEL